VILGEHPFPNNYSPVMFLSKGFNKAECFA